MSKKKQKRTHVSMNIQNNISEMIAWITEEKVNRPLSKLEHELLQGLHNVTMNTEQISFLPTLSGYMIACKSRKPAKIAAHINKCLIRTLKMNKWKLVVDSKTNELVLKEH